MSRFAREISEIGLWMRLDQGLFNTKTWFITSQAYSSKSNEDVTPSRGDFQKTAEKIPALLTT